MPSSVERTVLEGLRLLPPEQQQEAVEFVKQLVGESAQRETIWDKIDERIKRVPPEVWERIPSDGAVQHDHYLYGAPKK